MEIAIAQRAASNVRAELARAGVSQREISARLGRSQAWLSRRLTGVNEFTLTDLSDIAAALQVPLTALINGVAAA